MPRQSHPDPSAFYLEGSRSAGVLLIHGFTGSPPEMRLIGGYLNAQGYTVSGPLLPGHGTTVADMNRRSWREWADHVEGAYQDLKARCDQVFVGGLSMGTLLSVNLAAKHPEIPALALYAPAFKINNRLIYLAPLLKGVVPAWRKPDRNDLGDPEAKSHLWSYSAYPVSAAHQLLRLIFRVRRLLPRIRCPALIVHAAHDMHVGDEGARYVYDRIGSREKELIVLANSGHCLTVDREWESAAAKSHAYFEGRLG